MNNQIDIHYVYAKRFRYMQGIFGGMLAVPLFVIVCLDAVQKVKMVEAGEIESTWILSPAVSLYNIFGIGGVWVVYIFFVIFAIGIVCDGFAIRHKLIKSIGKEKIKECVREVNNLKRQTK